MNDTAPMMENRVFMRGSGPLRRCILSQRNERGFHMTISPTIRYVGVNDHAIDLFEGQYAVPHGMSYNSYVILDAKTAVMDT